MSEADVHELFKPFGSIMKLVLFQHKELGRYGFCCYQDPDGKDNTYGPACVQKAIDALSGREMTPGPDGLKLYIRPALNKSQRE